MIEGIKEFLKQECKLIPDRPLLVGVSGGPDSLCLAHLLSSFGYNLVIAHLNHGLREEAGADSEVVRDFAKARNIPFRYGQEDVNAFSESTSTSTEEAARILRYRFLFKEAKLAHAQAVVVGHNADDLVESVVMHLLRGAGISGLIGMRPQAFIAEWSIEIPIVRPLLNTWRTEILTYCDEYNLKPVFDKSNEDTMYFRNRIRQELIPELETYNPQFRKVAWRMSQTLAADQAVLAAEIEKAWLVCSAEIGIGFISLSSAEFLVQPLGIKRGIIRKAFGILRPGLRNIDFGAVERAQEFVTRPTRTKKQDLIAGLRIQIEDELVFIATWEADLPSSEWPKIQKEGLLLNFPAAVELSSDWCLSSDYLDDAKIAKKEANDNSNPFIAWLDADELDPPLLVRSRQPGDRFKPFGMEGHSIKLAEFFINVKIARRARDTWPIVFSKDEIVWVPGFRIGHEFRLKSSTQKVVKFNLKRVDIK